MAKMIANSSSIRFRLDRNKSEDGTRGCGSADVESETAGMTLFSYGEFEVRTPVGGWRKRLLDIVLSLGALVILSPLMLMVALAIMLTDGWPVFFGHNRIGYNGKEFRCFKFRTMLRDGDAVLAQHLRDNPQAAIEWQETQKLVHDPRVTLIGKLLRKTSLDELPQFFNVLRGDMSLIGPRPVVADELERYGEKAASYKQARPGISGLWQVSGRSNLNYHDRVRLDSQYVSEWSLLTDLVILFKTIPAVMRIGETS